MSYYDSDPGRPAEFDRWDMTDKILTRERREVLSPNVTDIDIDLPTGQVRFEVADGNVSELVFRVQIQAGDQAQAKDFANKSGAEVVKTQLTDNKLTVSAGGTDGGFVGGRTIVTGGNVFIGGSVSVGGVSVSGGEVWINGRRVTPGQGLSSEPAVINREVVLKLPKDKQTRGSLRLQSGDLVADALNGRHTIRVASADISIRSATGEINVNAASGDIRIDKLHGAVNLNSASGDVKIRRGQFVGSSRVQTASGDIMVGVQNDSLGIEVASASGDIEVDREVHLTKDTRRKRGSGGSVMIVSTGSSVISIGGSGGYQTVEGYLGGDSNPNHNLSLNSASGDIEINKM